MGPVHTFGFRFILLSFRSKPKSKVSQETPNSALKIGPYFNIESSKDSNVRVVEWSLKIRQAIPETLRNT